MENTLIQNLLAFASAAAGAAISLTVGVSHRQLCALISFAAGSLLAATFFHIVPEAWALMPVSAIAVALVSGYGLFWLISRYVFHLCPACAASHFEERQAASFRSTAVLLGIALTIHSLMDGMAIALGGAFEHQGHSIFLTITLHKLPEGLALCALFLRAGYSKKKSFLISMLLESSTLAGWALGAFLLKGGGEPAWLHALLIHIGGGFVYLGLHAAINEMEEHSPRFVFLFFLAGLILMGLVR